jgi:hypothetical protein
LLPVGRRRERRKLKGFTFNSRKLQGLIKRDVTAVMYPLVYISTLIAFMGISVLFQYVEGLIWYKRDYFR